MKYHLNIIDWSVDLPKEIDHEYDTIDTAYWALHSFVHSFDGKQDVCGRVCDENGEDMDYVNSFFDGKSINMEHLVFQFDRTLFKRDYVESLTLEECEKLHKENPHNVLILSCPNGIESYINSHWFNNEFFYLRFF